ncbi:uncharacterized protein LAJ45_04938 [Morchella importuna]|uniref:uncharacterized protein n=1 Tax=Morchella importuna TaxID=1174673 RepID=UPI001E8DB80F|nr:uncharacterized protein LAJ45_04938 [Morchella importuna]KAH8150759.1 hypothetical protein LAJ45_04938 [Morchella importuna]
MPRGNSDPSERSCPARPPARMVSPRRLIKRERERRDFLKIEKLENANGNVYGACTDAMLPLTTITDNEL